MLAVVLAGCNNSSGTTTSFKMLSYRELVEFNTDCIKQTDQQEHLLYILKAKRFDPDPDKLSPDDRAYNSRLKATLWWYEYRCVANKQVSQKSVIGDLTSPKGTEVKSEVIRNGDCQSRISVTVDGESEVSSNALTVCGKASLLEEQPKVAIGETVFETDLAQVPEINPVYFKHRHSKCRLFRERYMFGNVLQVNHGIICQIEPNMATWQVVDKW